MKRIPRAFPSPDHRTHTCASQLRLHIHDVLPNLRDLAIAIALRYLHTIIRMCFSCGGSMWPWGHAVHLADAPTKDEYIFLDQNHSFYKDRRTVSRPPTVFCRRTCPIKSSSSQLAHFHIAINPTHNRTRHRRPILTITCPFAICRPHTSRMMISILLPSTRKAHHQRLSGKTPMIGQKPGHTLRLTPVTRDIIQPHQSTSQVSQLCRSTTTITK